jgi:hypothetical protein
MISYYSDFFSMQDSIKSIKSLSHLWEGLPITTSLPSIIFFSSDISGVAGSPHCNKVLPVSSVTCRIIVQAMRTHTLITKNIPGAQDADSSRAPWCFHSIPNAYQPTSQNPGVFLVVYLSLVAGPPKE